MKLAKLELNPKRMNAEIDRLRLLYPEPTKMGMTELTEAAIAHVTTAVSLLMYTGCVDAIAEVKLMADLVAKKANVVREPLPGTGASS